MWRVEWRIKYNLTKNNENLLFFLFFKVSLFGVKLFYKYYEQFTIYCIIIIIMDDKYTELIYFLPFSSRLSIYSSH